MIKCPANYFGRGENYNLPDDPEIIKELNAQWEQWEREHPDDPTGEKALAADIELFGKPSLTPKAVNFKRLVEPDEEEIVDDTENVNLRLQIPKETCRIFKNYAKLKRMRPRELLILWVHKIAKL